MRAHAQRGDGDKIEEGEMRNELHYYEPTNFIAISYYIATHVAEYP